MTMAKLLLVPFLLVSVVAAASGDATVADQHLESVRAILAWVDAAEDGFVTPKQSVRRMVEGNKNTPLIIYATQAIKKGELLVQTPWSHILHSATPEWDDRANWYCGTAMALADEMKLGDKSFYAPYAVYLNEEPDGQLPPQYSDDAKQLLHTLIGTDPEAELRSPVFDPKDAMGHTLLPERFTESLDSSWYGSCQASRDDTIAAKAAALVIQRADDHILIPAYDAYNHRNNDRHNGVEYMNARTLTTDKKYHQTFALRDIAAGEQIFISYNMCEQCGGRIDWGFGTPEMFRDYGFVEWFPQRWWYPGFGDYDPVENDLEINQFDLYQNEDTKDLTVVWSHLTDNKPKLDRFRLFLGREIRRLHRLKNVEWAHLYDDGYKTQTSITEWEWSSINQFLDANLVAMTLALKDLERGPLEKETDDDDNPEIQLGGFNPNRPPFTATSDELEELLGEEHNHYDFLVESETDELQYVKTTCDNSVYYEFLGYIDTVPAHLTERDQLLGYFESYLFNEQKDEIDVCYDINNTVQACSSYRPYHHEYMVHAVARYLEKVKRVLFVGSGDSMLLHEILKYDDRGLEQVVGLELDQAVTRKAFAHFKADPHFDHPKVDWWFGDAAESLAILPEEYWGSFDLVLVDLPIHTLSRPVIDDIDVFRSLQKLVHPATGVFVYNEVFYAEVAAAFPHSAELYYQSASVCSETLAVGSHGIDLFHAPVYDHGIDAMNNLVVTPLSSAWTDRNSLLHHHQTTTQRCDAEKENYDDDDDDNEALIAPAHGVLELVTIEELNSPLAAITMDTVLSKLMDVVGGIEDLTILDDKNGGTHSQQTTLPLAIVVMEEGYVAARTQKQPDEDAYYLGFDIHLWSKTQHLGKLKRALQEAFPSTVTSSHKLIVGGGMAGIEADEEDAKRVGPLAATKSQNTCDSDTSSDGDGANSSLDASVIGMLTLEQAIMLNKKDDVVAVVVCGRRDDSDPCSSVEFLNSITKIKNVVPLYECWSSDDEYTRETLHRCERDLLKQLPNDKRIGMIVVDDTATHGMHAIVNSIFDSHKNRREYLDDIRGVLAFTFAARDDVEPWRMEFLDRFRKQIHHDPVKMAEFDVTEAGSSSNNGKAYKVGLVSTQDLDAIANFASFETKLQSRLHHKGATIELRRIRGGLYQYMKEQPSQVFSQKDYDTTAAVERFQAQIPLARQLVLQFEASTEDLLDVDIIERLVDESLNSGGVDGTNRLRFSVGDGSVNLVLGDNFHVVSVWDGADDWNLNIIGTSQIFVNTATVGLGLEEQFRMLLPGLVGIALDSQPRGLGRVANLPEDLIPIDRHNIAQDRMDQADGAQSGWSLKPEPPDEDDWNYEEEEDDDDEGWDYINHNGEEL